MAAIWSVPRQRTRGQSGSCGLVTPENVTSAARVPLRARAMPFAHLEDVGSVCGNVVRLIDNEESRRGVL